MFSIWFKSKKYGGFWDWVTLLLKKVIKENKDKQLELLDMGTGPYGILAQYAKKINCKFSVAANDHCLELIEHAKQNSHFEGIEYITGDLFENIVKKYDLILFNAPYIAEQFGEEIGVLNNSLSKTRWSGGEEGLDTIKVFLDQVPGYLNRQGICALGINNYYIPDSKVREMLKDTNLILLDEKLNGINKAHIYLLTKGKSYEM